MAKTKEKKISIINKECKRKVIEKSKPILGIDIGSYSLKIIKMKANHALEKWILDKLPVGIVNQGRIEAIEPLAEIIKKNLKTYNIKARDCALYISGNEVIVRELLLPVMNESQLIENIRQEIETMLSVDHGDYCIDYKVLEIIQEDNEEASQIRVLVGAVPKEMIKDYIYTMKRAGLKVKYIDLLPNIVGKIYNWIKKDETVKLPSNISIVDFGNKKTEIIILKDGNYYLHKMISYGGEYLTSSISAKSGKDPMDFEEFKCQTNFFVGDENDPINKQVFDYFNFLIRDFERTFEFYNNRSHEKVERIYIMGGGSLLKGLAEYLERQLSIEVRMISDIFEGYQEVGALGRFISVFSQAIGVTFREEWKYER